MTGLGTTIAQLATLQRARLRGHVTAPNNHLCSLAPFGSNPGVLRAHYHVPANLRSGAALVVVLHGCTQTAVDYDRGSGWSQLADEHGFAVLFPEQQAANNANLCFNWFAPADIRRDAGEAFSIRQMIAAMMSAHDVDPSRVFVTGLSAGGAMASVMLATYPDVFAGGAIIAGLAFGAALSVTDAFTRMRGQGFPPDAKLAALVRDASSHSGPWPRISVWQGSADGTVAPSNADRIIAQWRGVHALAANPDKHDIVDGATRKRWIDQAGHDVLEVYEIAGMGHGTPLKTVGSDACGAVGPYMLEAGISSSRQIARFFGLLQHSTRQSVLAVPNSESVARRAPSETAGRTSAMMLMPAELAMPAGRGVEAIITDALRAAGLMR